MNAVTGGTSSANRGLAVGSYNKTGLRVGNVMVLAEPAEVTVEVRPWN